MGEVVSQDSHSEYNIKISPSKFLETDHISGQLLLGSHFFNDSNYKNDNEGTPATVTRKTNNAVSVEGIGLYATRKITIGEEILMDYLWKDEDADNEKKWDFINFVKVPPLEDLLWPKDPQQSEVPSQDDNLFPEDSEE